MIGNEGIATLRVIGTGYIGSGRHCGHRAGADTSPRYTHESIGRFLCSFLDVIRSIPRARRPHICSASHAFIHRTHFSFHSVIYHIEKKQLRSLTAEEARGEELLLPAHSPCIFVLRRKGKPTVKARPCLASSYDHRQTQEKTSSALIRSRCLYQIHPYHAKPQMPSLWRLRRPDIDCFYTFIDLLAHTHY
ncbi:hypothetical protein N431DRAFT_431904 [Stipitochalara longipes BDJ]|nr:hypothetical protein N431DRAFT_431904 [Stipitochalara longipes BDJ]